MAINPFGGIGNASGFVSEHINDAFNTVKAVEEKLSDVSAVANNIDNINIAASIASLGTAEGQVLGVVNGGFVPLPNTTAAVLSNLAQAEEILEIASSTANSSIKESWLILNGLTGSTDQTVIILEDEGTHTDPVVGEIVNNTGVYNWSESPAGWKRIANTEGLKTKIHADNAKNEADRAVLEVANVIAAATAEADRAKDEADRANSSIFPIGGEIIVPERSVLPQNFTDTGDRVKIGELKAVIASNWNPAFAMTGANWSGWSLDAAWQDEAGTIAAVADGDTIAQFEDLSGNKRHMLQSDPTKRPTLRISGGRKWVEFGPNKWMAAAYSLAGASNVLACAGFEHVDDDGYVYAARSSTSMLCHNIRGNNTTARWMARMSPPANIQAFAPSPYVGLATVATQLLAGGNIIGRRNGVQVASATASGTIGHTTGYIYLGVQGSNTTVSPSPAADTGLEPWSWNFHGLVISTNADHQADSILLPLETWMRGKVLDNRPNVLNVLLAGGQSNADGRAAVSDAAMKLPNGLVQNVRIWNGTELMPTYNTDHTGALANGTCFTSGPEAAQGKFSFIDIAADKLAETIDNVVMCRVTMGSTALHPSKSTNGSWNADYDSIPSGRVRLLWELEKKFLALAKYAKRQGMELNVLGLLWHQGESDDIQSGADLSNSDVDYEARMLALIAKVREFTQRADLPIIMGTVPATSSSYNATIKTAQLGFAAADSRIKVYDFDAVGGTTYIDGVHFDAAPQIAFGNYSATELAAMI